MKFRHVSVVVAGLMAISGFADETDSDLPNILLIMSEDNSPMLGCYGDDFASTPNLDRLASQGFLYTHAYANAPVCAPNKNTFITGVYATSNGHHHMRCFYPISDVITYFTEYMANRGYLLQGAQKFGGMGANLIGREKSGLSSPQKLTSRRPFFRVHKVQGTHESSIHRSVSADKLIHDPAQVNLPPYHPDTK